MHIGETLTKKLRENGEEYHHFLLDGLLSFPA
jgi:hypothetical protein